jgi:hypothetical protein
MNEGLITWLEKEIGNLETKIKESQWLYDNTFRVELDTLRECLEKVKEAEKNIIEQLKKPNAKVFEIINEVFNGKANINNQKGVQ